MSTMYNLKKKTFSWKLRAIHSGTETKKSIENKENDEN